MVRKIYSFRCFVKKKEGSKTNELSFHFKKLENQEQIKHKVCKRKEIMVRIEINTYKTDNREKLEKSKRN